MGGIGSGRTGGRPTVESAYTLDVNELVRSGLIQPGRNAGRSMTWTSRYSGDVFAVNIVAFLEDMERPRLFLCHADRSGREITYSVALTTTPQHLGGRRWWFRCPIYHERVAMLHLPRGADRFACREVYRLGYATQRASPRHRAIMRCHRIRQSLGADTNPTVPVSKPHRMRQATFERKMAQLAAANGVSVALSMPMLEAMKKRLGVRRV